MFNIVSLSMFILEVAAVIREIAVMNCLTFLKGVASSIRFKSIEMLYLQYL